MLRIKEIPIISNYLYSQIFLLLLCILCYTSSLNGDFTFDDTVAIVKNADVIKSPINFTSIFNNDFWGSPLKSQDSHKSYRPLTILMFNIEYNIMGFKAKHMKIVNLILHCINTILVWQLLSKINIKNVNTQRIATISSVLFAIHPVHVETVCGVVGRCDLIFCTLFLLALLNVTHVKKWNILNDMTIILLTIIGMLFKETAITIPIACLFLKYMCNNNFQSNWRIQLKLIINWYTLFYLLITIAIILARLFLQDFEGPNFKHLDNPIAFDKSFLTRILSQNFLYVLNIWILFCPDWLCFDWALGCIKLVTSFADLRLQAVLAMYSFIFLTILNFRHNLNLIVAIGLMIIPFSPALGFIKVGFVIAERILYCPSIGFCYLIALSFESLYNNITRKSLHLLTKCTLLLMFACLMMRTQERAKDWLTEERLFTSALKVCAQNAKVHYNIARLASDNLETNKAFFHYHKAIELHSDYEAALMNLGNLYRETGDLKNAEKYIEKALEIMPDFSTAWMNLGIVQASLGRQSDALLSYKNALKYRKNYANCYYNMGNLYLDQRQYSEAMQNWQMAIEINPKLQKAWANILTMLDNRGLYEDVIRLSEKGLNHLPNETNIMFIRANAFGKLKYYVEAENIYKFIINKEPSNALYYTNLGVLYHRWGKLNPAIKNYNHAISLSPQTAKVARDNLNQLLKRIGSSESKNN